MSSIFENYLERDLAWREEELAALKIIAASSPPNRAQLRALLRALTTLLYAHFEGYCKFCWELYLENVAHKTTSRSDLVPTLKRRSLKEDILRIKKSYSHQEVFDLLEGYKKFCKQSFSMNREVDTKSNLWPDLFIEISDELNVKCNYITFYRTELSALVGRRNGIAHGKSLEIADLDSYEKFEKSAFLVMHELAIALVDAINNLEFLTMAAKRKVLAAASGR